MIVTSITAVLSSVLCPLFLFNSAIRTPQSAISQNRPRVVYGLCAPILPPRLDDLLPSIMNSRPFTILIVSPDRSLLRRLSKFLEVFGYDVRQATDDQQALAAAQAARPDYFILDASHGDPVDLQLGRQIRRIWPRVLEAVPEATITIIGRFAPPEVLAYSQKDVVTFADFVRDLRPHLQRHAVFVAPIISGAGLRGKILEALAMGKAVVATRRSVEGYPFVHGRELMVAGTAQEFSQHVIDLLQDPERRAALGRMGRARVEAEFNCGGLTETYELLHAELFQ